VPQASTGRARLYPARPQAAAAGRDQLERLVAEHGFEAVAGWLRHIEAARRVKRPRGRPPGPSRDDSPLLMAAASVWRRSGGGAVWAALTEIGRTQPAATPKATAQRLHSRLTGVRTPVDLGPFIDHGIADFVVAAHRCQLERMINRAQNGCAEVFVHLLAGERCSLAVRDTIPDVPALFEVIWPMVLLSLANLKGQIPKLRTIDDALRLFVLVRDCAAIGVWVGWMEEGLPPLDEHWEKNRRWGPIISA
jgi:hypothetical protein